MRWALPLYYRSSCCQHENSPVPLVVTLLCILLSAWQCSYLDATTVQSKHVFMFGHSSFSIILSFFNRFGVVPTSACSSPWGDGEGTPLSHSLMEIHVFILMRIFVFYVTECVCTALLKGTVCLKVCGLGWSVPSPLSSQRVLFLIFWVILVWFLSSNKKDKNKLKLEQILLSFLPWST